MADLMKIIEKLQAKNCCPSEKIYGAYLIGESYHACRIAPDDEVWEAPAIKIESGIACLGRISWDMSDHAHLDDAGDMPWDDESLMDWDVDSEYDMGNDDELEDLINRIN